MSTSNHTDISVKQIFDLAFPALGVLAAMPLYLLLDTAMVGRLGAGSLAALGAAAAVQSGIISQLTFLSYGTTSRSAKLFGAHLRQRAVYEGVQASWIAIFVGSGLTVAMLLCAGVISRAMIEDPQVAEMSASWLRISSFAIPLTLLEMAGNGWMRGVQNTRKPLYFTLSGLIPGAILVPFFVHYWGIKGSAMATVVGMGIIALLFVAELIRENEGNWGPDFRVIKQQLVLGRDLLVRSMAFLIALLSATVVAARFGTPSLAGHQILTQLWNLLTLVLDSLAIAAQALIGAALGAGSAAGARAAGKKITLYSFIFAGILATIFALGHSLIPKIFTQSIPVLHALSGAWWVMIVMIVLGGILFALDGVLIGAGDAAFLRTLTVCAVLCGYLPGVAFAYCTQLGLTGVWFGLLAFISIRMVGVSMRFVSMKWASEANKAESLRG